MTPKVQSSHFLLGLAKGVSSAYLLVGAIVVVYLYLMQFVNHELSWIPYLVVFFTITKVFFFTFFTFKKLNKSIEECHSFAQLLWIFGSLVFLIIFSFAADYACLSFTNPNSFKEYSMAGDVGAFEKLFEYFYFSMVTFASVGYGDIVPTTVFSKVLVIIEIAQSFVLIVFGLSNVNNIHTLIKQH
ncbi:MAG TPA: ion transporter [Cytophagales bacterium]|mgnify:FL=1|nr:ion transporter [Cytophagales bacterium]